ncbi:hypothetical protein D3C83_311500 [compost metagenome]
MMPREGTLDLVTSAVNGTPRALAATAISSTQVSACSRARRSNSAATRLSVA